MAGCKRFLEAAPSVCRLASGVVVDPLGSALTYEYEVCVTTEMPPPGSVEVRVAVTRVEDGLVLAAEVLPPEACVDAFVLSVVPCWEEEEEGTAVRGLSVMF